MAQDWSLTPAAVQPPALRGKGALITGLVLLVVGVVMAIAGIVGTVAAAANFITGFGSPVDTPTTISRSLTGGTTYMIYELTTSGTGTASDPFGFSIPMSDITVTAPDGSTVPLQDPGKLSTTFSDGNDSFIGVVTFDPPATGVYKVAIATEGATVILAPSFTAFGSALVWVALIGLGALLAFVGIILLIVGAVRRSSSKRRQREAAAAAGYPGLPSPGYPTGPAPGASPYAPPATPYAPPTEPYAPPVTPEAAPAPIPAVESVVPPVAAALAPAGWFPDPDRPGGQRYWDGAAWTEHRA
jgi:hypothetical protein